MDGYAPVRRALHVAKLQRVGRQHCAEAAAVIIQRGGIHHAEREADRHRLLAGRGRGPAGLRTSALSVCRTPVDSGTIIMLQFKECQGVASTSALDANQCTFLVAAGSEWHQTGNDDFRTGEDLRGQHQTFDRAGYP